MQTYERYIKAHVEIKEWLHNRPRGTQKKFALSIMHFSEQMEVEPEEWRSLDKFEARDLAWKFLKPQIKDHSSVAHVELAALKSFYRNKRGEQLPFDSGRGGKHYFRVVRKKAAIEHIPNKKEMYAIVDMASNLRDKALLLFLFQSGVRVNVIEHITYGDVQNQLSKDATTLKITGDLDLKLRGRDIPFYYTFLNGEGALTLKRFCEVTHRGSEADTPLFITKRKSAISQHWVWAIVKNCVRKAGFNPKTITTHTIRKAFRKIVRQTNIDDDDKEQLMGHVISGSRAANFDKKDVDLLLKAYQHCNFQREIPQSETQKLREQLESERVERANLETLVTAMRREMEELKQGLKEIKASS
ncbi:tyrosine-type recombinase/integrase [Candidatus Bathyarchaeota archaeon]|nr:tyrosine-type recombinase/integrase [Candidatus Bathyarchaeota archaeon]